jgi:two-component system response regulator AtoC
MMKRFVVLQEESLILGELARLRQASTDAAAAPSAPVAATASLTAPTPERAAPAAAPAAVLIEDEAPDDDADAPDEGASVDLQGLAKAAAMRAERDAIDKALSRFRWNRRKAAAYLNVSYKTLLNKMKECGITDSRSS